MKNYHKQSGAVIITVLLLLMVITLMGLTSIKQGLYQAKISSSEVAYNTCFMSAESGLNAIFENANALPPESPNNPLTWPIQNSGNGQTVRCLGQNGIDSNANICNGITNANIQVNMFTNAIGQDTSSDPLLGHELSGLSSNNKISTDSTCTLPGMDIAVTNTQTWLYTKPLKDTTTN